MDDSLNTIAMDWGGHQWLLRADRSMFWPVAKTLIVADPHFGKGQYFRDAGIPVPRGTTQSNLGRLNAALQETAAKRLVVLGDFFHSRRGVTSDLLEQLSIWRAAWRALEVINVRGNHDRQAGDPPADLRVRCLAGAYRDDVDSAIAFAHEPTSLHDAFTLCGHVHPGVRLRGRGRSQLRAACFHFTQSVGVLPAFGTFTGMKVIEPKTNDRVFAVGPGAVVEVTPTKSAPDAASSTD